MVELAITAASPAEQAVSRRPACKTDVSARLPSLDGWRAVSILLVLGAHTVHLADFPPQGEAVVRRFFDGHLGVRFFFVLSGFLITWLMLREERQAGRVSLRNFYLRRAIRILPVYLAFLGVLALLQTLTGFQQSPAAWFGNLTFTTNYFHDGQASHHLWSLAVEEQFYLLWPAVFVFWRPHERPVAGLLIVCATCMLACFTRYAWSHPFSDSPLFNAVFQEKSFINNADSLAIGCMAAVALLRWPDWISRLVVDHRILAATIAVILIILPSRLKGLPFLTPELRSLSASVDFIAGRTLQSLGFMLLMLQSIQAPRLGPYRLLNSGALSALGVLSYSIYIWQQLFCTDPAAFGLNAPWWSSYRLWILPAVLAAFVSYHVLERPLLRLRRRFR
jgi:peptidoglycan/LPS O-acetylase OafA/YrhL